MVGIKKPLNLIKYIYQLMYLIKSDEIALQYIISLRFNVGILI
jgi:hypothetical protein